MSPPRSFAANITNLESMTHTFNMITTPSHSAATTPRHYAQMLSCYSVVTGMAQPFNEENQERKKIIFCGAGLTLIQNSSAVS